MMPTDTSTRRATGRRARHRINVFLGREVKRAIDGAGLTRGEIARRIDMPRITLSRRLSGRVGFTVGELGRIAFVLGEANPSSRRSIVEWVVAAERTARIGVEHKGAH